MEFRILGPLEVTEDGREIRLGGVKQRALLALLLLNPNRVVSRDRLIDELWETDPPDREDGAPGPRVAVAQGARPRTDRDAGARLPCSCRAGRA